MDSIPIINEKKIICVVGRIEHHCENGENPLFVLFLYPQTASLSTDSSPWKALGMRDKTNQLMPCERCWLWNQLHPISFLLTTAFVSENELSFIPLPSSVSSAELALRMAIPPTTSLCPWPAEDPGKCQVLTGLSFVLNKTVQHMGKSCDVAIR